jgi:peptidoglycan/xylan/chitin deacetylase (PgdA/CDA1 family)
MPFPDLADRMTEMSRRIEAAVERGGHGPRVTVIAVRDLLSILDTYEMPGTFAFVMAFVLRDEELTKWGGRLADVTCDGRNWMENFRRAETKGHLDGWFCPEALEMVMAGGRHEIGCHGFRHVPFSGRGVTEEIIRIELDCAREIACSRGVDLQTFIFPRNEVARPDILAQYGYRGFRNAHPRLGRFGRIGNLLRECDVWEGAQPEEPPMFGIVSIPGGSFINWQKGARRLVPRSLCRGRWKSIIADAAENDRIAGVFLHPHNLIDGPATLLFLKDVLGIVAEYREKQGLRVLTQAEYCAERTIAPDSHAATLKPRSASA